MIEEPGGKDLISTLTNDLTEHGSAWTTRNNLADIIPCLNNLFARNNKTLYSGEAEKVVDFARQIFAEFNRQTSRVP